MSEGRAAEAHATLEQVRPRALTMLEHRKGPVVPTQFASKTGVGTTGLFLCSHGSGSVYLQS